MPAHHRFHPYEIQTIALFISFIPCFAAIFLAFGARHLEALRRKRLPAFPQRQIVTRASRPVFTHYLLAPPETRRAA
ncbi:MAG: hypothetical protein M3N19_04475 [Candidatus Eremiobacteraeota bacterium]|nr:hypothetical protein [Candidatus Eremiobacteraeota bacterium]